MVADVDADDLGGSLATGAAAPLLPESVVSSAAEKRAALIRARIVDLEQRLAVERRRLEAAEDELSGPLRGADVATRALRRLAEPDAQNALHDGWIHYTGWFELVQGWEGVVIAGDDPLATFLTAIYRDERIEGKGNRTGLYRPARVGAS